MWTLLEYLNLSLFTVFDISSTCQVRVKIYRRATIFKKYWLWHCAKPENTGNYRRNLFCRLSSFFLPSFFFIFGLHLLFSFFFHISFFIPSHTHSPSLSFTSPSFLISSSAYRLSACFMTEVRLALPLSATWEVWRELPAVDVRN